MDKAAIALGIFVMIGVILMALGCQTKQAEPVKVYPIDEIVKLTYLIASERYMRETDDCLLRGLICRLSMEIRGQTARTCQAREEECVFEALRRWETTKERMGW